MPDFVIVYGLTAIAGLLIGVLIGGTVGVALGKWPARSVPGSTAKGAAFGMGLFIVFALFIVLVLIVAPEGSDVDMIRS